MLYLIMGKEKVEVASATLSKDGQNVTAYRVDGSRAVLLEGVNLENVCLEDSKGNKVEFDKPIDPEQEIADLKAHLKQLTVAFEKLSATTETKAVK
ncbi:hypothetical protein MOE47_12570 [Bacillus atrophaeus]|uniref:hypothetical protein n=1 Tax=Bacillus atrophaeus TaxID=1452 RepID=UPI00228230A4|nr:hypothetical protein [Bacillus atrophaeus]MCY8512224.1 hypothetical protein [Bacillus atrophaeus]MCY8911729.1 hypothetical protein [Bacillus atrophaeus]MCY8993089.1 hypothetical protein [Bacillus atrophaeus]MCY9115247.1 hypothetical protein [Bacillus atrophaeus]MEC0924744.1 hypothetical protein [Bacillus atrophaeus]